MGKRPAGCPALRWTSFRVRRFPIVHPARRETKGGISGQVHRLLEGSRVAAPLVRGSAGGGQGGGKDG
eukprot:268339-Pyramimonas_sp.AAC.1